MLKSDFDNAQDFIAEINRVLNIQRRRPDDAEYFHHKFILGMPPIEEAHTFSLGMKIAQLHYFMQYVYNDAHKNSRFKTITNSAGSQEYIDEAAYSYEIAAIKHIKRLIRPPIELFDFLDQAADYVAQSFDDPRMTEMMAIFPYMPLDDKLAFSEVLGHAFFAFSQHVLQMPVKETFSMLRDDPEHPFIMASYMRGKTEDGKKFTAVTASSRCLNQPLDNYLFDMFHEHVHSLFDQMATIYSENPEECANHPYKDSLLYVWSISHTKGRERFFTTVYDVDMEEMFCNGTAARFHRQIARYDPKNQITHQPLLEM